MSRFTFTLGGGLGDYILRYLGFPGNRFFHINALCPNQTQLRVSAKQLAGQELLKGNILFRDITTFEEIDFRNGRLPNDIEFIQNIKKYNKFSPQLWLEDEEEERLFNLKQPYAVFHPYASDKMRTLSILFDIKLLAQWIADVSGIPLVVLGKENFGYQSNNVFSLKGSVRLAVKAVERASFFVGTHSSMQCAAWIYNIPSFCIGPNHLLLHNLYAPNSFDTFLKPLFKRNNLFMLYEQAEQLPFYFDLFLRRATSLSPLLAPQKYNHCLVQSNKVYANPLILDTSAY